MSKPNNYTNLLDKYSCYIANPPLLNLDTDEATGEIYVQLNLEFTPHSIYGQTKFRIREKYDSSGELIFYRYSWEKNRKPESCITCWENEHGHGFESDPHVSYSELIDTEPYTILNNSRFAIQV